MWFLERVNRGVEVGCLHRSTSHIYPVVPNEDLQQVDIASCDRANIAITCEALSRLLNLPSGVHITSVVFHPSPSMIEIYTRSDNPTSWTPEGAFCTTIDHDISRGLSLLNRPS
jgi:hypothetical protein